MSKQLPPYVKRGGEQVYASPFIAEGVEFFGFAVKSDPDALQKNICDHFLNGPLGETDRFVPLTDNVLFVFNTIESLYSKPEPFNSMGWFPEKEAAVWTALVDRKREQLFWFHPYMIVDLSYAMAMGRELYGFPKTIGWHDIPKGPEAPNSLSVETVVVEEFTAKCEGKRELLFSVNQNDSLKSHESLSFSTLTEFATQIISTLKIEDSIIKDIRLAEHLFEDLVKLQMPMAFLKQFRDGADPTRACYQALQEVVSRVTKLDGANVFHHGYEIDINDFASHPIRADLGLPSGPIASEISFWTRFDFEIDNCSVVQEITS